jgi:DNA-binding NarL/FixJ family response regulator
MGPFLIVDDHSAVREGLGRILGAEFPSVALHYAASPKEALAVLDAQFCALAVVDISMPGGDGVPLIQEIKDRSPRTRILVHTMHPEDQFGLRALRAGADGFVTKDTPVTEILAAVRKIIQGGRAFSPAVAELLIASSGGAGPSHGLESLSEREFQILRLYASGKTTSEIAETLNLSVKTVSSHRARILEKLGLRTTAELIRFGLEHKLDSTPAP